MKTNHLLFHAFSQNGESHSVLIPISDSADSVKVLSNRIGALAAGGEAADCRVNSQVFKNDEKISSSDKCKNCHCKNGQVSVLLDYLFVYLYVCLPVCLSVFSICVSTCLSLKSIRITRKFLRVINAGIVIARMDK